MRKTIFAWAAVSVLAAVAIAPASAQGPGSRKTREFVQAAGQSDQFEILESQAALTQATNPEVRAFAQRMIQDHSDTQRALQQATARAGLEPPSMNVSADQAQFLGALQSQIGVKFDQTYMHHQALAHRSALVTEQAYAASGDNPEVRHVAVSGSAIIAAHLTMAEQMSAKLGS
jgi:putative membrane protein